MPVSQREVADRAGVSARTVSNVVNGYPHVSPEVYARVQQAIRELGYRRNDSARGLRLGRTGIISLAVPNLLERYFADLADAAVKAAEARSLTMIIELTRADPARERLVMSGGDSRTTDGALISALRLRQSDVGTTSISSYPVVLIGNRRLDGPFDHVGIANERGAHAAVAQLASLGRRRIALLGDPTTSTTGRLRRRGYRLALRESRIAVDDSLTLRARWSRTEGERAVTELIASGRALPDAIFALNDSLALGALAALRRARIAVPAEVAVSGFDDIGESRYADPPLTSVAPHVEDIAATAVALLVARIADPGRPAEHRSSPYSLQVRASSRP